MPLFESMTFAQLLGITYITGLISGLVVATVIRMVRQRATPPQSGTDLNPHKPN